MSVVDGGQAQVELQGLLPVVTLHLQGGAEALTFALLQPGQVCQQPSALLGAGAPQQAHPGLNQRRQRAVIATGSLERTRRLTW